MINTLPEQPLSETMDVLGTVVGDAKLLKLAKVASPPVHAALYNLLAVVATRAVELLAPNAKKVATLVLQGLQETDAVALVSAWGALLAVLKQASVLLPEINLRKTLWPALWALLRDGGRAAPDVTYQQLVPMLQALPSEVFFLQK